MDTGIFIHFLPFGIFALDMLISFFFLDHRFIFAGSFLICNYPSDVKLSGHCVVKLVDNNNNNNNDSNQITLLSFGGYNKHTLVMKYVSVWSNDNQSKILKILNKYNQWIPFTYNHNHPIIIGRKTIK
ncbi:hypothetical protein RFI_34667 [Reticulomyxa filosa]|uniref:Uncharacterized protein n=1 Tax=Reticulomyxa filosa TaxID=46433 RepID=X6LMY9_RETFI|nr:hypothetical protein RFI_34667 [Reticulomyxa filosa]|eukprot:ETO02746.1 hypothetical protein RFI_34667 [Reticulomyxa filosa]